MVLLSSFVGNPRIEDDDCRSQGAKQVHSLQV